MSVKLSKLSKPILETSVLDQVDGSAVWAQDQTKVICSVTGPVEVKSRDELPNAATLDLVVRPSVGLSSTREHLLESKIYSTFSSVILRHINPRSLIQIVVQILEPGEPVTYNTLELSNGINATSLALVDAGIPLIGIVTAVSIAILKSGKLIINPTAHILGPINTTDVVESTHAIAYELKSNQVTRLLLCESTGRFTEEQLFECLETAAEACVIIHSTFRKAVANKIQNDFVWKQSEA